MHVAYHVSSDYFHFIFPNITTAYMKKATLSQFFLVEMICILTKIRMNVEEVKRPVFNKKNNAFKKVQSNSNITILFSFKCC